MRSTRTVFSSSWTRREQAEKLDEWQITARFEYQLLLFITQIAAKISSLPRQRLNLKIIFIED